MIDFESFICKHFKVLKCEGKPYSDMNIEKWPCTILLYHFLSIQYTTHCGSETISTKIFCQISFSPGPQDSQVTTHREVFQNTLCHQFQVPSIDIECTSWELALGRARMEWETCQYHFELPGNIERCTLVNGFILFTQSYRELTCAKTAGNRD